MYYEGSEETLWQPFSFTGNRLCREVGNAPSHPQDGVGQGSEQPQLVKTQGLILKYLRSKAINEWPWSITRVLKLIVANILLED